VQNLTSCGTCNQLAAHADWLIELAREAALPSSCGADFRRQAEALSELFRSFFASDDDNAVGLFFLHGWCLTDRSEYGSQGLELRDVPGTASRSPFGRQIGRLAFDPAGHRSIAIPCARLRWTAGPQYDASELRQMRVSVDRRLRRGTQSLSASHYEQLALADPGREFANMLLRGGFPYHQGRTLPWPGEGFVVHDFLVIKATRLRPVHVEEGAVLRAIEECLVVLLDRETGEVARVSTKHGLFAPLRTAPPEESSLWPLLSSRRGTRSWQ
jgi:hypothetical protein